jgi:hypothetical protein
MKTGRPYIGRQVSYRVDLATRETLIRIGKGNESEGVRRAARVLQYLHDRRKRAL